ncbi:hypothetical protein L9F63_000031, partial [Diploptera punctata]
YSMPPHVLNQWSFYTYVSVNEITYQHICPISEICQDPTTAYKPNFIQMCSK